MTNSQIISFFLTAMAIASITVTISKGNIFLGFRNWITINWLKKHVSCAYCLSHSPSFLAVLFLFSYFNFIDFIIKSFAMVVLSSIFGRQIMLFFNILEEK